MRLLLPKMLLLMVLGGACQSLPPDVTETVGTQACTCNKAGTTGLERPLYALPRGALLASRFDNLEELASVICIDYFREADTSQAGDTTNTRVLLRHCSQGEEVTSELVVGLGEGDFRKAQNGDVLDQAGVGLSSPYSVAHRDDLGRVIILARRRYALFGEGDPAFFDLALTSVEHINTPELAYLHPRDSSEKGFLNTFNHMTAQAFITSFFSEELADFVADVHERHHMPELISGQFTPEQLVDPDKNPVDNYVDIINNEWGQELGKELKEKYGINRQTVWTPELLTNYLNDIQAYYSWALQVGFEPYRPEDEVVIRFAAKINAVMNDEV